MQLNDVLMMPTEQDRGRWFEFLHPVDGAPTHLAVLVAGPDSNVQATALATMTDELAEVADLDGRVSGLDRALCHRRYLARCCLDWKATEGGVPVPFAFDRMVRLLGVAWVKSQVDAFAANRGVYFVTGADLNGED